MSCVEEKIALRVEMPNLKGMSRTKAYEYFKNILGNADDVDVAYDWYNGGDEPVEFY